MTLEDLKSALGSQAGIIALIGVGCTALGWILNQVRNRVRTLPATLRWSVVHSHLATSGQHRYLGDVGVTFNGDPVSHLHLMRIGLRNDSIRDLSNLTVAIETTDSSDIYGIGQISRDSQTPFSERWAGARQ